jgi:hypothetical protein
MQDERAHLHHVRLNCIIQWVHDRWLLIPQNPQSDSRVLLLNALARQSAVLARHERLVL